MNDNQKTKKQLIKEVHQLHRQLSRLTVSDDQWYQDHKTADLTDYSFRDLVNIEQLQGMLDILHELTGFPIGIVDVDNTILVATGWQDICTKFHRCHPETLKRCYESDHYIEQNLEEGISVEYKCKNGLWDIAQPIIIEGIHVATVFLGQFIYEDEKPDLNFFIAQAEHYGFDKEEYLAALDRLPVFSRDTVKKLISFYVLLAKALSQQGLATLQQLREIESRKQAEQELHERQRRLSTLMANLPGMAYRCRNDETWTMEFVSNGCQELTGYAPDDLIMNQTIAYADLIHTEDRQAVWDIIQSALGLKQHFLLEYRITTKDEQERWVWEKGCGVFSPDGEVLALEGFIIDVTVQKIAEDTLRRSEEKYRSLIQNSNDAIFLFYQGRFEIINDKFKEMFDITLEEINSPGFDLIELFDQKSRPMFENRLNLLAEGKKSEPRFEFTGITKKGKRIEIEASISYLSYRDGLAVQGILRDITERKQLERQLIQSQKMESIGTLTGGIAHDFNNLLTVINGHAEMTLLHIEKDHPCHDEMVSILQAGKKAENLIRQLLAFSRKQIYEPEIVEVNGIITGLDKFLQRLIGEDIKIETVLSPGIPLIKADPGQLDQILMNLVINARDALNELQEVSMEKKITIETFSVSLDEAYVSGHIGTVPGPHVVISVSDSGIGMDDEVMDRIFDPFFTTKDSGKGTGLGLSTVYGIVRQNNGSIYVYSEKDHGTTFKIYWPAAVHLPEPEKGTEDYELPSTGSEHILFVEDDEAVRRFACDALSRLGYRVFEASSGTNALSLVKEIDIAIDLLITDLIMPGMNGKELADEIAKLYPDAKVLFSSGYTDEHIVHSGALEPGVHFIQKPYSVHSLSNKIRDVLGKT
jgi:two-component system cell cycle sensor histidine kinase/response regulator CckA